MHSAGYSIFPICTLSYVLMVSWQCSRQSKGDTDQCLCACVCGTCVHKQTHQHLDIKPLSVPARGRGGKKEKKLQHISGIFQLMMCGCGSTGEREPLTVLSLFRSLRAPRCIPVCCAYFGNSCRAPFFLFYCIQFVCCSCTFISGAITLSLPLLFSVSVYLSSLSLLNHLSHSIFLSLSWCSGVVVNFPFCRTKERKRGKVREE